MEGIWRPDRPLVYGYLCMEEPDEAQTAAWSRNITSFCATAGYRLGSIFIDRSFGILTRGGFVELLAALRLPGAVAVVVPSLAQLSTEEIVQQVLVQMVQLTNSQLLVAQHLNRNNPDLYGADDPGAAS